MSPVAQVLRFTELALLNHNHDFESSKIWRVLSNWGVKPPSWLRRLAFFHCDVFLFFLYFCIFVFAAFYCDHIATGWARVPHSIRVLATQYVVDSPVFTVTFFVLLCGLLSASMLWLSCHRYGKSTACRIYAAFILETIQRFCVLLTLYNFNFDEYEFDIVSAFKINEKVAIANPSTKFVFCRLFAL